MSTLKIRAENIGSTAAQTVTPGNQRPTVAELLEICKSAFPSKRPEEITVFVSEDKG